jgi:glycosyltransferase involved in cell wall biosynthesis
MGGMARVTVVVATVNARDAILATAETILRQRFRDFDFFITDDGSTDGTGLAALSRFGPDTARAEQVWGDCLREDTGTRCVRMIRDGIGIHYLHQVTARGPGAARNRALVMATGEMFAFAEPGDLWHPDKLAQQVRLLDEHADLGAVLSCHRGRKRRAAACRASKLQIVSFESILEADTEPLGGSLVRRACLNGETPFDENLPVGEEFDFWLRLTTRHAVARWEQQVQVDAPATRVADWGLERFRVYTLEKAYQGGHLGPLLRHRVAEELVRQCEHLVDGYRQRENQERANFYDRKRKRFAQEITKLEVSDPVFSRVHAG